MSTGMAQLQVCQQEAGGALAVESNTSGHAVGLNAHQHHCTTVSSGLKAVSPLRAHAGVAVTVDMLVTTSLVTLVMLLVWQTPKWLALPFFLAFGAIEGAYFSATLLKVPHGGWCAGQGASLLCWCGGVP